MSAADAQEETPAHLQQFFSDFSRSTFLCGAEAYLRILFRVVSVLFMW